MMEPVVKTSRLSHAETVGKLTAAIAGAGATLFAKIDQSGAAAAAGMKLRPTTLLIFGNPKAGTLLMDAAPLLGLDLPLRFLIWQEDGTVKVAYVAARAIAQRYDVTGQDTVVASIDKQLQSLLGTVT